MVCIYQTSLNQAKEENNVNGLIIRLGDMHINKRVCNQFAHLSFTLFSKYVAATAFPFVISTSKASSCRA